MLVFCKYEEQSQISIALFRKPSNWSFMIIQYIFYEEYNLTTVTRSILSDCTIIIYVIKPE